MADRLGAMRGPSESYSQVILRLVEQNMKALIRYLKLIVEPTIEEFMRNPTSIRHAYLACVATYHAVDRVSFPDPGLVVAEKWREKSMAFALVEIVALDFKHVRSRKNKSQPNTIPISAGDVGFGEFYRS